MPWRGPRQLGEFPTLGYDVADLIEATCKIPDGDHQGEPFGLTDEMLRFLLRMYRVDPETGLFVYDRGAQLCRPQKWGKGPFSAAIAIAEAHPEGPVRPNGWDAAGEPVGKPWVAPEIQITGITEDNAGNVWRALVPMIKLGDLAAEFPDTGTTRINLPGGGMIRPVTSAQLSRIGQRLRFVVQDQTESWWGSNNGRALADAQRRNLAGMGGRFLETPNAWDPAMNSVAQYTQSEPGVCIDDVDPGSGSIRNKEERRRMLRLVYRDSLKTPSNPNGWVLPERIESEIEALLPRDPAQAERWFLNRKRATEDAAFDGERWDALATGRLVDAKSLVTVGVHGSRYTDALVIVVTEVESGFQWVAGAWESPERVPVNYEHPVGEIHGAMTETFGRFDVWRAYVGPALDYLLDPWAGRWGDKRVLLWDTNQPRRSAFALRNYREAMGSIDSDPDRAVSDLAHDGNEVLARHVKNARRRRVAVHDDDGRAMWSIGKDRPLSPHRINGAWAACLSWEARGDAIAAGATQRRSHRVVSW